MKKRIFSFLLAFVMLVGMLPVQAFAAASIPSDAPFSAITTDAGDVVGIQFLGSASVDAGWTTYSIPHYHIVVPADTDKVIVTYPSVVDYTMEAVMTDGTASITAYNSNGRAEISGNELTITVSNYLATVDSSGWKSGTGLLPEYGYDPNSLLTFEYEAAAEPTPPAASSVPLPNGTLSPAIKISDREGTYFDMGWGNGLEETGKYKVSLSADTETVTINFDENTSLYFTDWDTKDSLYYLTAAYDESVTSYVPCNNGRWETAACTNTDGKYSIQLDVKTLITEGRLYAYMNENMAVPYLLEFEYVSSSGGEHTCVWDDGEETQEATCQKTGVLTRHCTVSGCDKTTTEEIPKKDHSWSEWSQTKAPTCQTDGEKTRSCTYNCGATEKETITASADYHQWDEGVVSQEATCMAKGKTKYTCQVDGCGETKEEENIPKLTTHNYGENGDEEFCTVEGCNASNPDYVDPNMPTQDESGVYQIGTAEQLLSFAKFVNKGNTNLSAVLTADIDLTGKTWTPMSSSNAAFSFDGQGHTITFGNASNGLFAVLRGKWGSDEYNITSYATVSNVIIEGSISGAGNVGAIAGEAYGVKISKCLNCATIVGSGNNVGGIVGLADRTFRGVHYSNIELDQCANIASIQGSAKVGGLIGGMAHTNGTFLARIKNSYNWGEVTGNRNGGLIGDARLTATADAAVTIENSYTAGYSTALINYGGSRATITNTYFLSDTDTSDRAKTEEEMKSADFVATLGEYFRKGSTYPILSWQSTSGTEYAVTMPSDSGVTVTGMEMAYSDEDYTFTVTINNRYRTNNDFAILVNGDEYTVEPDADGVYNCTVPKGSITADLVIEVRGVEATKTVLYTGSDKPVSYGYVKEIAIDDVTVKETRVAGDTIYVTLAGNTPLDASVYFTVATGGNGEAILGIQPGKTFTKQLNAGGLTQEITATMPNSGSATWTVVITVDGIVSHKVTLPTGEGYTVHGNTAVVDGQDYTFTVEVDDKYSTENMVVKAGTTVLTPDSEGVYKVEDVKADLTITVENVTKKPFEDPFTSILVDGTPIAEENIIRKTEEFALGGAGDNYGNNVYKNVPYYYVTVPEGTEWVNVVYKAFVDIMTNNEGTCTYGYETDVDSVDAVSSPTIRPLYNIDYTKNEDETQTVKTPVTGYFANKSGGEAFTVETAGNGQRPVALFCFTYRYDITLPEADTYTVIPQNGYTTSVPLGDDFAFTVRTKPGYVKGDDFAVTVDNTSLVPDSNGVYKITNITENTSISVAGVEKKDSVTAYLSISHDDGYMVGQETGEVMALQKLEVPWFDLSAYGLQAYAIPSDKEDYREPTVLHLYIYATEVFYCKVAEADAGQGYLYEQGLLDSLLKIDPSQGGGSLYFKGFWNEDENLNYYVNYNFPKYANGTGATADWLTLNNGDVVTVGHFSEWGFKDDPDCGFNYIKVGDSTVNTSAKKNDEITFEVWHAGADVASGNTAQKIVQKQLKIYCAPRSTTEGNVKEWQELGTTDETGKLTMTLTLDPGQYVVAVAGRYGTEGRAESIVSAPGAILLTILEDEATQQVNAVMTLIDEIGEVTVAKEAAIDAAWTAYQNLDEDQQSAVTNINKLLEAKDKLAALKKEKEDQDAAVAFAAKVDAIGTVEVTDDCKAKIDIAKAAYELLSDEQKELAKAAKEKLDKAESEYAKLIADEQDNAAADAVEAKITAIGTVTLNSEAAIKEARDAYDALTDTQKLLVENLVILQAAEKKLAELKDEAAADAVAAKIAAIGEVKLDSEEDIKAARAAYDALTDTQKALVENLAVLEAAEEALELLKLAGTDITKMYQETGSHLASLSAPGVGTTNGEWRVIGLSRAGKAVADGYYNAAVKFVKENIDENGRLHESKSTDNSRLIVALTAIGRDVTDVDGYDLLSGLNDMAYIGKQGINGTIWALIAFDTHDYEIPAGDVTREKLVQTIVGKQCADGGWSLNGVAGDPDITGMALQALAPYYQTNSSVQTAVDKALAWLSGIQSEDGTFTCSEGVTSESLAQVITGLTALGINPETDSRFVKNGVSAMDALSKFYLGDGNFQHGLGAGFNMMATEQAYYALVSYYRMLQGKTSLYDMSDVTVVIPVYKIIEGANSDWQKDDDALTIRADGEFAKFTGVKMDGKLVDSKHYTAKAGSTVITFRTDYLKTLSEGEHTVTVVFKDGEAATSLSILPTDEEAANRVEELIKEIGTVTKDSEEKIKAAKEAYDQLTEEQKKLVDNYKVLTEAEEKLDSLKETITVTFTLLGDSIHGDTTTPHTLSGGGLSTWIGATPIDVKAPATVLDVLTLALKGKYSFRNDGGNYISSINGLAEFTNGANSGWMYTLNGYHPNLGVAEQSVKNGDVIVFHYTDDYTKESGNQSLGDRDEAAAAKAEAVIETIGTVTLESKGRIDAARKAYDALTFTQKKLVGNYDKLTAAEAKYAELKKADDEKKADAVEKLIDQLDSHSASFETDVKAAQNAYNVLTADQKKLVDNYTKLAAALKELANEEDKEAAEAVEKLIKDIGSVTKDSKDKIKAAREAYNKLTDEQKALVENLKVLEAAEEKLAELNKLENVADIYKSTGDYLEKLGIPTVNTVGGEWMVIGLARSGRNVPEGYYDNVVKFVQENIDESERLHNAKSTENARVILALTAIGKDVTDVDGHNLLSGLNDMDYVCKQGINGPIWALLAFDSGNYPTPVGNVTRDSLIHVILEAQLADGGWALSGDTSDADMTGMALQALAPYCAANADVKAAVAEAIATLTMMQAADGSFASIDGTSSESSAQVIAALAALGIDAHTDVRFIKNGISALDALCAYYVEGSGFKHIPNGNLDGMATEQSYYALAAYFRMLDGKTALYDMTDVIDMGGDVTIEEPVETLPAETEPAPTEPVDTPAKEGRSFPWWLVIVIVVLAGTIVVLAIVSKPKKGRHMK